MKPARQRSAGFALVAAIFLLLVMAGAVVAISEFLGVRFATNDLVLQGNRAWWASRAGLEWAVARVLEPGDSFCQSPENTTLSNLSGSLSGFQVTINCVSRNYPVKNQTLTLHEIESLAWWGHFDSSPDFASRTLRVTVTGP
jgi:MSHA biogenesis protein MshP